MPKNYEIEREGQIAFFHNFRIDYENNSVLIDNTDGVWKGNILEFKLNVSNLNKVVFQTIKYLSKMRIKGESVPANILIVDLNQEICYLYHSQDYFDDIHKVYMGGASTNNENFVAKGYDEKIDYSTQEGSFRILQLLQENNFMKIKIDENCVVGWSERYYNENPTAKKGDFLGDDTGKVKIVGEIREPKHFKDYILPFNDTTNERFKFLMDVLNDKIGKKDLGAFYTLMPYAKKACELVKMAISRVPEGNDYIILDRCCGTGNLEQAIIDELGDDVATHIVCSTYEYYEYKVLIERLGDKVRAVIPPTEANVVYENGKVSNADAMSKDFIENPLIKQYVDNDKCTIILFENPPYDDTSSIRQAYDDKGNKHTTKNKESYVFGEMNKVKNTFKNSNISTVRDTANRFIWSGFKYYLRQDTDSYVLFSPVKYFKSLGIFADADKRFAKGYMFNRKHFHASASSIGCILWTYGSSNDAIPFNFEIFDIVDEKLVNLGVMTIKTVNTTLSASNTKYIGKLEGTISSDSHGYEAIGKKCETSIYIDDEVIGYFCPVSASYDLGRLPYFNGRGNYVLKSNFKDIAVLFSAKMYDFDKWYEKGSVFITFDGGTSYKKDSVFEKSCLIYTCLSNQNKCLSFDGSDGRYYRNELCFDTTNGDTVASNDLTKMTLDTDEKALMKLWNDILNEAKKTTNYNSNFTYGVYQIAKELNTSYKVGTGKSQQTIYDYPTLNGYLETLRVNLKAYYKSHITNKMFQYELLK